MKKYKSMKHNFYFILAMLSILTIGIGYAALNEKLSISNSSMISEMKWDVGFYEADDNGSTIEEHYEFSADRKTITLYCNFGSSTKQETCSIKASILNNSTFDIGLTKNPTITYDDKYIHTVTLKWNNHPTYENHTVLKDNFIEKGKSEEVVLTIKSKFLDIEELPTETITVPITVTLNFEEWRNGELPQKEDLAVLKATSSSDTTAFRSETYKEKIKTITFDDKIDVPTNATESWDIGVSQNGNVIAYVTPNTTDSTYYDLHIQSDTQLYANTSMASWFANMTNVESIKRLELMDTSMTTSMNNMFSYTGYSSEKFDLDISKLDTSQATNMSYMFSRTGYQSKNFTLDTSHLDTSKVTNMGGMFIFAGYNSTIFTLDVSNFDTSKTTNMNAMFQNAGYNSTNYQLDVSSFNTKKVTNMSIMFYGAGRSNNNFTLDLGNFDTSKVTDMSHMFYETGYSSNLFTLDLSNFDTSNVTKMRYMFSRTGYKNPNFTLIIDGFNTSKVVEMEYMFDQTAYNSTKLNISITIRNKNMVNYSNLFYYSFQKSGSIATIHYTSETEDIVDQIIATKSNYSNVVKGEKVDILYSIGKEINIGTEKFNVIRDNGSTITMLAQNNLGTNYKQSSTSNQVYFSNNAGWEYTPGPKEIDIQQYEGNTKNYLNKYKTLLSTLTGDTSIDINLITLSQLKTLDCNIRDDYQHTGENSCRNSSNKSWLDNGQNWWTSSASPNFSNCLYTVLSGGGIGATCISTTSGVRPIITISKETIETFSEEITFVIDSIEYKAIAGMTWEEWINSEYNTAGYYLYSSVIYYKKLGDSKIYTLVNDSTTRQENKTNIIIPNQSYGHRDSTAY